MIQSDKFFLEVKKRNYKMKKEKRFFYSVVEELSFNRDYDAFRMGRVEIHDSHEKSGYPIDEARFIIPNELFPAFRKWIDFKESDNPIMIRFEMDVNKFVDANKKKMSDKKRTNKNSGQ